MLRWLHGEYYYISHDLTPDLSLFCSAGDRNYGIIGRWANLYIVEPLGFLLDQMDQNGLKKGVSSYLITYQLLIGIFLESVMITVAKINPIDQKAKRQCWDTLIISIGPRQSLLKAHPRRGLRWGAGGRCSATSV